MLGSYFWGDDLAWLFLLHEGGLGEFLITPMGGHTLVARNAIIALLDAAVGLDARAWFATVLATHALNTVLLGRLIWLTTGRPGMSGLGAFAWGVAPPAAESLGWYAVYGQVAAATCLLLAFGRIAARARTGRALRARDLVFVAAWLALSGLFFGSVVGVALAWPLVAPLLAPAGAPRTPLRVLLAIPAAVLGSYALFQALGATTHAAPAVPVQVMVWLGRRWWPAVVATIQLLRVGIVSLLAGAWWSPALHSDPASWAVLVAAAVAWSVAVAHAPGPIRRPALAWAALAAASYALIAAARAPLAGPLFGQTAAALAATPRYHYVPQAFLAVAACLALGAARTPLRQGLGAAWLALLVVGLLRHGVRVDLHPSARAEIVDAVATLRRAIDAAPPGGAVTLPNRPIDAMGWLPNTVEKPPGLAALFVIAFPDETRDGPTVRFAEPNPLVREAARRRGGRTAGLLVPPP